MPRPTLGATQSHLQQVCMGVTSSSYWLGHNPHCLFIDYESDESSDGGLFSLFLRVFVYGSFNDHITHHLFPTIDLSRQHLVRGVFLKTAREFGVPYAKRSYSELFHGTNRVVLRKEGDLCYVAPPPVRAAE